MIVKKKFERLVNLGNYENVKVGIVIESEVKATDAEEIKKKSLILGRIAEVVVNQEVDKIKSEKSQNHEEGSNG